MSPNVRRAALLAAIAVVASLAVLSTMTGAQSPGDGFPRLADGHVNLSGIWQANNTANWDLLTHQARQGPMTALGAAFSVPGGARRRRRQRDSLQARGAREKGSERRELAGHRSGDQVLPPRRAARHLHAVSLPNRPGRRVERHADHVRVCEREPDRPHEHDRREPGRHLDGLVARPLGGRHARRRRDRLQRRELVRPGRQLPDASLHVVERYTPVSRDVLQVRSDDRGPAALHALVEDQDAPLSPPRKERATRRIQVRRVRRRADVRAPRQRQVRTMQPGRR